MTHSIHRDHERNSEQRPMASQSSVAAAKLGGGPNIEAKVASGATGGNSSTGIGQQTSLADPQTIDTIVGFIRRSSGIEIGSDHGYLVVSRLDPVAKHFGLDGLGELAAQLRTGGPSELKAAVVDAMTTNETSFFRNKDVFDAAVTHIIPAMLDDRDGDQSLTIWCAACSSGQEVYSLAIALCESFPNLVQRKRFRLLASDLSPRMVRRTRDAVYSSFEVSRGLSPQQLDRHFNRQGRDWVANEPLRRMVETRQLNLLAPWKSVPQCDLVLMRNVLIYFGSGVKHQILERLREQVLTPSGVVLLGATESILPAGCGYVPVRHNRSLFYQMDPQ